MSHGSESQPPTEGAARFSARPGIRIRPSDPPDSERPSQVEVTAAGVPQTLPEAPQVEIDAESAARYNERLAAIETLLLQSRWDLVLTELQKEEILPPELALVFAIAAKELGDPRREATPLAIRSMACLFGVPEGNAAAVLCGKRLVRNKPPMPDHRATLSGISLTLIATMVLVAAAVGFWAHSFMVTLEL